VDYKEFVDVLARDTVAPAALGKRDMQASDAMGIDEFAKAKVKNVRASINDFTEAEIATTKKTASGVKDVTDMRFKDMRTAYRAIDKDFSHGIDHEEIVSALRSWNMGTSEEDVELLVTALDENNDGTIDYNEFSRGLVGLTSAGFGGGSGAPAPATNKREAAVQLKPMVLKTEFSKREPATEGELHEYVGKMRNAIETKYSLMQKAFRAWTSIKADASARMSWRMRSPTSRCPSQWSTSRRSSPASTSMVTARSSSRSLQTTSRTST